MMIEINVNEDLEIIRKIRYNQNRFLDFDSWKNFITTRITKLHITEKSKNDLLRILDQGLNKIFKDAKQYWDLQDIRIQRILKEHLSDVIFRFYIFYLFNSSEFKYKLEALDDQQFIELIRNLYNNSGNILFTAIGNKESHFRFIREVFKLNFGKRTSINNLIVRAIVSLNARGDDLYRLNIPYLKLKKAGIAHSSNVLKTIKFLLECYSNKIPSKIKVGFYLRRLNRINELMRKSLFHCFDSYQYELPIIIKVRYKRLTIFFNIVREVLFIDKDTLKKVAHISLVDLIFDLLIERRMLFEDILIFLFNSKATVDKGILISPSAFYVLLEYRIEDLPDEYDLSDEQIDLINKINKLKKSLIIWNANNNTLKDALKGIYRTFDSNIVKNTLLLYNLDFVRFHDSISRYKEVINELKKEIFHIVDEAEKDYIRIYLQTLARVLKFRLELIENAYIKLVRSLPREKLSLKDAIDILYNNPEIKSRLENLLHLLGDRSIIKIKKIKRLGKHQNEENYPLKSVLIRLAKRNLVLAITRNEERNLFLSGNISIDFM